MSDRVEDGESLDEETFENIFSETDTLDQRGPDADKKAIADGATSRVDDERRDHSMQTLHYGTNDSQVSFASLRNEGETAEKVSTGVQTDISAFADRIVDDQSLEAESLTDQSLVFDRDQKEDKSESSEVSTKSVVSADLDAENIQDISLSFDQSRPLKSEEMHLIADEAPNEEPAPEAKHSDEKAQPDIITEGDIENSPDGLALNGTGLSENAAGAVIGTVSARDADGDALVYDVDDARFEIVEGSLKLKEGVSLDHEAEPSVTVTLTATDPGGLSTSTTLTLDVADVNDRPDGLALDGTGLSENAAGAVIGTVSARDADGDALVYDVDDARFEIVEGSLKLKEGVSLDHEAEPSVTVTLTATDPGGLSTTQVIDVSVSDINEAPVDIVLDDAGLMENVDGGVVGQLSATDADGDALTYAVDDPRFEVVEGRLQLKDGEALDYETESSVTMTVIATDPEGLSTSRSLTIEVGDENETNLDITVTGAGPDVDDIALWLDANDIDGDGHADQGNEAASGVWIDKSGNGNNGKLVGSAPEQNDVGMDLGSTQSRYTIAGDDQINKGTFTEKTFAVSFETGDSTDGFQVLYEQGGGWRGYSITIAEHPETGAPTLYGLAYNIKEWDKGSQHRAIEIGPVEPNTFYNVALVHDATPSDADDRVLDAYLNGEHAGQLTGVGMQYNHPDAVGIGKANNGSVHPVTGSATNSTGQFDGTISEVISWNRALDANDVADLANHFDSNADQTENVASLMEDAVGGSLVATLAAKDDSGSQVFETEFVNAKGEVIDHPLLEIVGSEVRLKTGAVLDHETADQIMFNVRASDEHGNAVIEEVTLNVLDVNEAPATLGVDVSPVVESTEGGTTIGSVSATDEDDGDHLTFNIVDGENRPIDHPLFEIVDEEIRLKQDAELDYDDTSIHEIRIAVTDSGGNTKATIARIEVEEAPPPEPLEAAPNAELAPAADQAPADDSEFILFNSEEPDGGQGWVEASDNESSSGVGENASGEDDPMNGDVVLFEQSPDPADAYVPYERNDW